MMATTVFCMQKLQLVQGLEAEKDRRITLESYISKVGETCACNTVSPQNSQNHYSLTHSLTNTSQHSRKLMRTLRCFNNTNEHAWTCQVRLNICPPFAVLHQQVELLQTAVTSVADAVLQELGGWRLHTVMSEHLHSSKTKATSLADPNWVAVPTTGNLLLFSFCVDELAAERANLQQEKAAWASTVRDLEGAVQVCKNFTSYLPSLMIQDA
jgi:hypothetical protein